MDNDKIVNLAKAYPQYKCLRCTNLQIPVHKEEPHIVNYKSYCILQLEPLTCGRGFSPLGGQGELGKLPPIKPRPKDGVELNIPKTEELIHAT
mgnify:CR=1 FL=1